MSTRQKSFFQEQGRRSTNWQRHKNNNYQPPQRQQTDVTGHGVNTPIAASTEAKDKLGAFSFQQQTPVKSTRGLGKENVPQRPAQSPARLVDMEVVAPVTGPAKEPWLPPSTPAVRLPLADLLGHNDKSRADRLDKEASPEEELSWMPNKTTPTETPSVGRRKRAHSSSPATSSQNDSLSARKALELHQLQRALKTPKADPADDLWLRYKSNNGDGNSAVAKLPSLTHLLQDSSPQGLPRTPGGSISGLRRWASCGNEWPATNVKRRKVQGTFRHESTVPARTTEAQAITVSRLGTMVDQIQATLSKAGPRRAGSEPSSSSPLPENRSFEGLAEVSPVRKSRSRESLPSAPPEQENAAQSGTRETSESFDYDDNNIDLAALAAEVSFESCGALEGEPDSRRPYSQQNITPADVVRHHSHLNANNVHLLPIEEVTDEFEDDNDLTVEELELAMTQAATLVPTRALTEQNLSNVLETASDDEDFGGLDFDDAQMAAAEMAATQAYEASGKSQSQTITHKNRKIQRYLVKSVEVGTYINESGQQQDETVLLVEEEKTKSLKAITLRQSWLNTHCYPGAYVHVVGRFSRTGHITINDKHNLIIVHPDHLVSSTAVADSFDCLRKAVLQDRVKATNATSKATVYGTILHELFQVAMQQNQWDTKFLDGLVAQLVIKHIEGLFEAGAQDINEAIETLTSKMPELHDWAKHFVRSKPHPTTKARCRNGKTVSLAVTKLLDVEEHVWSPTYGLKGNVDATVEVIMEDESGPRRLTVPFEVKTGKHQSAAHQAQTALYTLLLSDRYDVQVQYGILYYMDNSVTHRIPAVRHELRHMVMQRNELASYVRERLSLPPMLKNEHKCGRCYAKTSCFLYHKLSEDGTPESAGVGNKFAQVVSKLQPAHQDFFKKWDHLLTKEETEMFKFRRELWTMLSVEREKLGRCFSEVVIEAGSGHEDKDAQKINRFTYTLLKKDRHPGFSFTESQIVVGEPIVISSEQGHFALANGFVVKVSQHRITVAVDRRLHNARTRLPGFDEHKHQIFAAIMQVDGHTIDGAFAKSHADDTPVVYRLDKDEFSNGMATVRNNLLAIMDDEVYRSFDLRKLLIENTQPHFKTSPTAYSLSGPASQMQINSDQMAAIDKIMSAEDYALVLGMPGTGKTTTIAHIIRALVARGKSVLLTSYTHTAVDNILLKLRDSSISVLRLGALAKVHPEVQEFAKLAAVPRQSIEELEDMYMTPQVVATTCLGINHQLFHKRVFDYCVVDEASQITLPVCLGPIRMARTFVLVGDHYQLPPLVQNKEALEGGLDISLFKLLSERQPSSVVNLEHQYRMCADIMHLSNTLIYSGRLKCGNSAVADRTLHVAHPEALAKFHSSEPHHSLMTPSQRVRSCQGTPAAECMLASVLDPARKVVFVDTDKLQTSSETLAGARITNPTEVQIVHLVSSALLAQGVAPTQVGIITFYRSQLALLRQTLRHTPAETVEMHTADKFQGRDKEVVLLSCVRSNADGNVGELLRDWRRVNVAITRARSKFIIVGSRSTLRGDALWRKLIAAVEGLGGVISADSSLLDGHQLDRVPVMGSDMFPTGDSPKVPFDQADSVSLREARDGSNRGTARKPLKQAKVGRELLLKRKPVSQDIMNMIVQ